MQSVLTFCNAMYRVSQQVLNRNLAKYLKMLRKKKKKIVKVYLAKQAKLPSL